MLKLNPEWENARYEIGLIDKNGKMVDKFGGRYRFSAKNLREALKALQASDWKALNRLAAPHFIETI